MTSRESPKGLKEKAPKCEKKLTENFDVTMSQCHNVTKLKLPPCNTARWELTKHRAEKPIVRMNEGHEKVSE